MFEQRSFSQEQFVWLLGATCQMHRVPFDPQLVLQQFPRPHNLAAAAIHLGTRTVLEYLLSPVQKAWHEAGRER